jgi:hypothetical protein
MRRVIDGSDDVRMETQRTLLREILKVEGCSDAAVLIYGKNTSSCMFSQ